MPAESLAARKRRAAQIFEALARTYPEAHCELDYRTPLELLVATILSARCTDKQVNRVTPGLFARYRSAADYAQADPAALEAEVKSIGLFRNKVKSIRGCCRQLVERHGGEVPRSLEALVVLDGVGRKTANVVLGNAFQIAAGIVVDTHVIRVSGRLRLSAEKDPEKIERDLQTLVPPSLWTLFSHWLIWHGRRRCYARKPDCLDCEIRALCPTGLAVR